MAEATTTVFIQTAMILSAPLILASMGGLTSERSGVMNIALEGKMLASACVTFIVSVATGNAFFGILAGIGASIVLSLLHAVLTQAYRVDHIVSGMAINALSIGGTKFLAEKYGATKSGGFMTIAVWYYVVIGVMIVASLALFLARFRGGLRLFAVGNDPEKCRQNGVEPVPIRFRALVTTGVCCGLGGALIVTNAGQFNDGMTAGKGFIALAALILGGWRPLPTLVACLAFGFIEALQLLFQGGSAMGAHVPSEVYTAFPYVATLVALTLMRSSSNVPKGLGQH